MVNIWLKPYLESKIKSLLLELNQVKTKSTVIVDVPRAAQITNDLIASQRRMQVNHDESCNWQGDVERLHLADAAERMALDEHVPVTEINIKIEDLKKKQGEIKTVTRRW